MVPSRLAMVGGSVLVLCTLGIERAAAATRSIGSDRRFPTGQFCPFDHRDFDFTFVPEAATVTITITANNFTSDPEADPNDRWCEQVFDNITVVEKAVFDAHLAVTPGFEFCYFSPGDANTPAYLHDAPSSPEVILDLFDSSASPWSLAQGAYFAPFDTAPRDPSVGGDFAGGGLGLGLQAAGDVVVSTTRTVSGLIPGRRYVLAGWWTTRFLEPIVIDITPATACADGDGDGATDCTGDCDDANPAIWATPGEVPNLLLTHDKANAATTLSWNTPASPGGSSLIYDTLRAPVPYDFYTPLTCVETNNGPNTTSLDTHIPPPGAIDYFLVRAENACRQGIGTLGTDSLGTERIGGSCAPSSCVHNKCTEGVPLLRECDSCADQICLQDPYCCNLGWDALCVSEVRSICNSVICPVNTGSCAHHMCTEGEPLSPGCDDPPITPSCVTSVCNADFFCCLVGWDSTCVSEVGTICGLGCF